MKKNILFVLLLCLCGLLKAQITISKDKPLHFSAGFVIGGVSGYTSHHLFDGNPYWTWAGAVGSSFAAGVVKESMDKADYGIWDDNDILFTTLGGIASGFILDLFLKKSKKRKRFKPCDCYSLNLKLPRSSNKKVIDLAGNGSHDLAAAFQAQRILREGLR
jgi:hypothetical protein